MYDFDKFYNMSIGDIYIVDVFSSICRVPNGWIFKTSTYVDGGQVIQQTFIPEKL